MFVSLNLQQYLLKSGKMSTERKALPANPEGNLSHLTSGNPLQSMVLVYAVKRKGRKAILQSPSTKEANPIDNTVLVQLGTALDPIY